MLKIQPNLTNSYNKQFSPAFGRYPDKSEYVDYTEIYEDEYTSPAEDGFNLEQEKADTKKELDLWKQTKQNLDSIAHTTESVPGFKTGTKILSGLISIAIGWGGLRWGTVGTLEVLSKIGKTDAAKYIKTHATDMGKGISKKYHSAKDYLAERSWVKSFKKKLSDWKSSFLESSVGKTLSSWKKSVKENIVYEKSVKFKDNTKAKIKKLNPKRVFVETMGVAGGGTAAVNTIGANTIDGNKYNVEQDEQGRYYIDGMHSLPYRKEYRDAV